MTTSHPGSTHPVARSLLALATCASLATVAALAACTTQEMPPADSAMVSASASPRDSGSASPATTPPAADEWQMRPDGVRNLRIGMTAADTRQALGLAAAAPFAANGCEYIDAKSLPVKLLFMAVSDSLARIDVRDSTVATAEGARIGDTESRIKELYGDRVRVEPHKYTDGHYLVVSSPADTMHLTVFETDGQRVTTYRVGRKPAVQYVEGCS